MWRSGLPLARASSLSGLSPSRFASAVMRPLQCRTVIAPFQRSFAAAAPRPPVDVDDLMKRLVAGDRVALSRAITLVESQRFDHQRLARTLLGRILAQTTGPDRDGTAGAFRIGLCGPPGVGKSSFIEAWGSMLTKKGYRVAVLSIDPSSSQTGGSILGDKTRMTNLARDPNAYIRPSATWGVLGGVSGRTYDTVLLCSAAQYDVILIETVGVGQSETDVADLVDMTVLLTQPGGGDDLQAMKKGIMETVDLVLVNKADGDLLPTARHTCSDYLRSLSLCRPRHPPPISYTPQALLCSTVTGTGLDRAWDVALGFRAAMCEAGEMGRWRERQRRRWLVRELQQEVIGRIRSMTARQRDAGTESGEVAGEWSVRSSLRATMQMCEDSVAEGTMTPRSAAVDLIDRWIEIEAAAMADTH